MLDKIEENPYQLGERVTLVDLRVGSRGHVLEEISNSSCGIVLWGRSMTG